MDKMYCYVCDILGYKNIMLNLSLEEQRKQVFAWKNIVDTASEKFDIAKDCLRASDTLFVKGEYGKDNLKILLELSQYILEEGIRNHLPIRGAIAFGDVVLDQENDLVYGDGVVNAYNLAESQDWIGTCCESYLPGVDCLWDFDLVFVYPAPMKNGKIIFCPVVSWSVPEYVELRNYTVKSYKKGDNMDWIYANRIQHTIMFDLFLKGVKHGVITAKPQTFPGDLPMWHVCEIIDEVCSDANYLRGGYKITQRSDGNKVITQDDMRPNDQLIN